MSRKKKSLNYKVLIVALVFLLLISLLGFQLLKMRGYCGDDICQESEVCKSSEIVCIKDNGVPLCYNPGTCDSEYCEKDCT